MNGNRNGFGKRSLCALFLLGAFSVLPGHAKTSKKNDPTQLRQTTLPSFASRILHLLSTPWEVFGRRKAI